MRPTETEFQKRMAKAKATNAKRDQDDRKSGFGAPGDRGKDDLLRTAACAIEAGLRTGDWSCVAEGLVMLGDACDYRPWVEPEVRFK